MMKGLKRKGNAVVQADRRAYFEAKERKARVQKVDDLEARMERIERLLEKLVDEQTS